MLSWKSANFDAEVIKQGEDTLNIIKGFQAVISGINTGSKALLEALSLFSLELDARAMALELALNGARNALNDLLKPAAGHLLVVPPIPPFKRDAGPPVIPIRGLGDLAYAALVNKAGIPEFLGDGGNYGVYRKFVESLFDEADFSRPQYSPDTFMAGAIVVLGATNYLALLRDALNLSSVLGIAAPTPVSGYQMPVPQNVKVRPIAVPRTSNFKDSPTIDLAGFDIPSNIPSRLVVLQRPTAPETFTVRVSWDPVKNRILDFNFGNPAPVTFTPTRVHVYVKPYEKIKPGEDISAYEEFSMPIAGFLGAFGGVSSVLLRNVPSQHAYYVSVAFSCQVSTGEEDIGDEPVIIYPMYETLSHQARISLYQQSPYQRVVDGKVPDWIAVQNPMMLLPAVQDIAALIQGVIDSIISSYAGYKNEADYILDQLTAKTARLEQLTAKLSKALESAAAFNALQFVSGAHVATFTGRGGVSYLMKTVGDLLLDPSVPGRPPYDQGDEFVMALVMVSGSETAAGVADFLAGVELLFGSTPPNGFTTINTVTRVQEQAGAKKTPSEVAGVGVGPGAEKIGAVRDLGITSPEDEDPC